MKHINRRFFFKYAAAVPAFGVFFSCDEKTKTNSPPSSKNLSKDPEAMELSRSMDKKQVFSMLDQRVAQTMEISHNCAQSTFYALSEQFGLGGDDVLKALTPLPGIAERGQTCGAITGALMAMGLIYGREQLDDWEKYRKSLIPTNKFCENFENDMGTTQCCEIQDRAFGQSYNLMDPDQLKEFQHAGATTKCTKVVQKACRFAAEIILENNNNV